MLLSHHALLRASELLTLKWEHIAFLGDTATVSIPPAADKTNHRHDARVVTLPTTEASPLVTLLREQRDANMPVCTSKTYRHWNSRVKRAAQLFGWGPGVTTHAFRAGGATDYLQAGADPETVRRLGRWASDSFQIYNRPQPTEIARELSRALSLAALGLSAGRKRKASSS